jgi:predicted nucleotidyltransferase
MMSELSLEHLRLPEEYRLMLVDILRRCAPDAEVWAYGSRVTGSGHDASDLDLVLRNPVNRSDELPEISELKDALTENNLPIRVEVVDWARIPASFHQEIMKAYVVLQRAQNEKSDAARLKELKHVE